MLGAKLLRKNKAAAPIDRADVALAYSPKVPVLLKPLVVDRAKTVRARAPAAVGGRALAAFPRDAVLWISARTPIVVVVRAPGTRKADSLASVDGTGRLRHINSLTELVMPPACYQQVRGS